MPWVGAFRCGGLEGVGVEVWEGGEVLGLGVDWAGKGGGEADFGVGLVEGWVERETRRKSIVFY